SAPLPRAIDGAPDAAGDAVLTGGELPGGRAGGGLTGGGLSLRSGEARTDAGGPAGFAMMMNAVGAEGTSTAFAMAAGAGGGITESGVTIFDLPQGGIFVADVAANAGPFLIDFTDRRFLLRLKNSSGAAVSLAPGDIANISVRSYPSNPRLGLAFPDPATAGAVNPDTALFFWRADGEIGNGTPVSAGAVDAGADLEKELARGLKRFVSLLGDVPAAGPGAPTLPANLDVALVVESDAPCILDPVVASGLPAVRVEYHLARKSFTDGEEKKVLRFEPKRVTSHATPVTIPSSAQLISASVVLDLSVRADGSGDTSASALATPHAVRIDDSRWAAQAIELGAALTVSSIAMGVAAVTRECDLIYELRADSGGSPDGAVMAGGTLKLESAGQRRWALARLERPVVVSTAKHWLILGTSSGSAIWLAEEGEAGIRMLRREQDGRLKDPSRVDGMHTLHAMLTAAGAEALDAPLRVAIGEHAVDLDEITGTKPEVDLTSAAAAYLSAASAATLPIRIEAAGPGSVTVYPPRIVYDPAGA
ncbi:MAG TPA: hypothetical protein VMN39_02550, partial [Longimicrobiaceae bacterium]|nr:hypothetical protein [Longimicrobiaceae bacterium]